MAGATKTPNDMPGKQDSSGRTLAEQVNETRPVNRGGARPTQRIENGRSGTGGLSGQGVSGRGATPAVKEGVTQASRQTATTKSSPTDAAVGKVADRLPGGKPYEQRSSTSRAADYVAGKAAKAALVATGVGTAVADFADKLVKRIGVARLGKYAGGILLLSLTPLILLILAFGYIATHPWEAVKKVVFDASFRRFAFEAAKQAGNTGVEIMLKPLAYEQDYKPNQIMAAPKGVRPEPGTLLDTISKIDMETSRNRYKPTYCQYKVITKKVVAYDGKQRNVLDKITDKKGKEVALQNPSVFNCVLEQYPVLETMLRSNQAREINKQMQVNLSYAEKKDSKELKGKSREEIKKSLYKKSLNRIWSNPDSPYGNSTECVKDFKPTGAKVDRAIKKVINDLACGVQPEKIDVDYKVEEIPKSLDTDSSQYDKRLIQYTKAACVFYKKLNEDKNAVKKYQLNRAKSSAKAGFQALTLADTGVAGDISTDELNGDFYKISNFASSRAYNQEVNGSSRGVQVDPEAIPSRVLGLTRDYFEGLRDDNKIRKSLFSMCSQQDKIDDGGFSGFGSLISTLFGGGGPSKEELAQDIDNALTYLKKDIQSSNSQYFSSAEKVTLEDIIVRTIMITSNASNSGVEDGPDNFNRMILGTKNSSYAYTMSLLWGTYQTEAEATQASVQVEQLKRSRDKENGIAYRIWNRDNPRSVASRLAAESTATPTQLVEKTSRYALDMLNPIRAFAEVNSMITYVGYGETNRAIAAMDDDRSYWKIDTAGVQGNEDPLENARYIEALKKKVADPAYANDETIKAVGASFAAWDKCMNTYYPDMQTLDDSDDRSCQLIRQSNRGRNIASSYFVSSSKYNLPSSRVRLAALSPTSEKALARKYATYKGNMNFYGAWARLSKTEKDTEMYASSSTNSTPSPTTGPTIAGLTYPPNLGSALIGNYYVMPEAQPAGIYIFSGGTPANSRCGSKELIGTIYTVAQQWAKTYPGSSLIVGDLNAPSGHKSHKKGVDVDITVTDRSAANVGGDRQKSIQLGKWFMDTGIIKYIFYNDTAVQQEVNAYARANNKPGVMQYEDGHATHFHVRIADQFVQPLVLGCPR